jgi:UDP-N-acetylglucosamine 2-epimerase (non-hydrolysing)
MLIIVYGTRPEYIKVKPVYDYLKPHCEVRLLKVGQHSDLIDGCEYDDFFEIKDEDFSINRLQSVVSQCLSYNFIEWGWTPKAVLVQGDTNTALGMALNAYYAEIPVYHLEAGLRTGLHTPFPEEMNRTVITQLADIHLCPTEDAARNVRASLSSRDDLDYQVFVVGNTVIDNLTEIKPKPGREVIITLHRRENEDTMYAWCDAIETLACAFEQYQFTFIVHPKHAKNKNGFKFTMPHVDVIDSLPYNTMRQRIAECAGVITDSGGLQEECNYFGKICYVCRSRTERPCQTNVMTQTPGILGSEVCFRGFPQSKGFNTFGTGESSSIIGEILLSDLG